MFSFFLVSVVCEDLILGPDRREKILSAPVTGNDRVYNHCEAALSHESYRPGFVSPKFVARLYMSLVGRYGGCQVRVTLSLCLWEHSILHAVPLCGLLWYV